MSLRIPPNLTPIAGEGNEPEAMPINSIWYRYLQALQASISSGGIPEAPINGITYGRNNATWVQVISGAPVNASYVVMTADPTLTQERVLTAGTGITITDGGANGAVTISSTATTSLPGTPNFSIQYNNGGVFAGSAEYTIDTANSILRLGAASNWVIQPSDVVFAAAGRDLTIRAGKGGSGGAFAGTLYLETQDDGANPVTGNITIRTGSKNSGNGTGAISIKSGLNNSGGGSGLVEVLSGIAGGGTSGSVTVGSGSGSSSGVFNCKSGDGTTFGSGNAFYGSGRGNTTSGNASLVTGDALTAFGISGDINITTGSANSTSAVSGNITIQTGTASGTGGTRGSVNINATSLILNGVAITPPVGPCPTLIAIAETYTVPQYTQILFALPITVDGTLTIDGDLVEVT